MEERKIFSVSDLMAAIASNATKYETFGREEGDAWAINSKFYNQVMEDGHIFNPYLHRRFVPSQFLRMMKYYNADVNMAINNWYGYMYSIEWVKEEVRKLAFLQKADPIAFEERKWFLTIDKVKDIISNYIDAAKTFMTGRIESYYSVKVGKHRRIRTRTELEAFKAELDLFNSSVQTTITYETMDEILRGHYVVHMPYSHAKSKTFVESFAKAGAYYTLKHLVMFEHLSLNGKTGADACAELNNYLDKSSCVIYDALKNTIANNNYSL